MQVRAWRDRYHRAMAKLLLNLRNVMDDEIVDVRAFLDAADIAWYETAPSRWGISYGGIWLSDAGDLPEAKRLMAVYQVTRSKQAREAHAQALSDGTAETFADIARAQPMRVLLTVIAIVCLLGLVALPVLLLNR